MRFCMKKYIIGTIFGFILATAVGANAQGVTKLIDQVVQGVFPVTVDGASIGEAVVIDNKTYLPVREFGEAVGYKVTFTDAQEVVLTKNAVPTIPSTPVVTPQPTPSGRKTVAEQIDDLRKKVLDEKEAIEHNKIMKHSNEEALKMLNAPKESVQQAIDIYVEYIADNEKRIADYESQIANLQKQ